MSASVGASEIRTSQFIRFWTAQSVSQLGQRFGLVALPVVAIETLHAGTKQVGYLTAAQTVCYLLIGLPAGAWVDRWLKRPTMIRAAVVRALALIVIPLLWFGNQLSLAWLYAVALIVGVASVFFDVAYQSYVPIIVSEKAIESANARLESSAQVSAAGGPAAAGLILKIVSAPVVIAVDAVAYLLCAAFLTRVKDSEVPHSRADGARPRLASDVLDGVRFVVGNAVLRRICIASGISNFFATIVMTMMPLLILKTLGLGPSVMGIVLGVGTLGGLLASITLPKIRARLSAGNVMTGGLLAAGVCMVAFPIAGAMKGAASVWPVALLVVGQFGMTWCAVTYNVTQVSVRQKVCPTDKLARMNASMRFVVWSSMPLASILAGWLGSRLGVVACVWIGVVGAILTALPIVGMDRLIETASSASVVNA